MPCHSSKFDAKESQALFKNCNLGPKSHKLLRKHIRQKLGCQLFASENKIHKLGDGAVPPDTSSLLIDEGQTTIDYYTKPMDEVIKNKMLEVVDTFGRDFSSNLKLEVNLGGDHGQGSLQNGIELVLTKVGGSEIWRDVLRLAEVECKKDTAEIIRNTIINPINEALERMLEVDVATGNGMDGHLRIFRQGNLQEEVSCFYSSFGSLPSNENNILTFKIPFQVKVIGDLALYASLLGKDGCSSRTCFLCKVGPGDWQKQATNGEFWTLNSLKEASNDPDCNTVKEHPLLKRIAPDQYEIPRLHLLLGVANDLLENFLSFVDERKGLGLQISGRLKEAYGKE